MPSSLLATAAAVSALAAPAFGPARQVRPLAQAVWPMAVADDHGNQLIEYSRPGRLPGGIVVLSRSFPGPWQEDPVGAAVPSAAWLPSFAAAGDGAALLGWADPTTPGGPAIGALVRGPGGTAFREIGDTLPAGWQRVAQAGTATIDAGGRIIAVATVGHGRAPSTLELAVRQPGGGFGAPRVLAQRGIAPSLATSPGGRAVLTWSARGGTRLVTIDRGVMSRPVRVARVRYVDARVAVGTHGEAAVVWSVSTTVRGRYRPHRMVMLRGRHGGFGRPFALPASAVGQPVIGDDGALVHAQVRSAPRRTARSAARRADPVVVEVDVTAARAPHRTRRFMVGRGIRIAGPVVTAVRGGVLVAWTTTLGGDDNHRGVRAVYVRRGRVSRVADVADYPGVASRGPVVLRGAEGGATIAWATGNRDAPYAIEAADTAVALGG